MAVTRVSLTGGDSATLHSFQQTRSEVWAFPDGLERLVTLPTWYWNKIERLPHGIDRNEIATTCFEVLREVLQPDDLDFENQLHRSIANFVVLYGITKDLGLKRANTNDWVDESWWTRDLPTVRAFFNAASE